MTVPPPSAPAPDDVPPVEPRTESEDADGTEEGTQEARAAQRELFPHAPAFILDRTGFGGSLVGGARHGVSGGGVAGDVFLGGRTENHYYNGAAAGATHVSGEISRGDLDALAAVLVEGPAFASAPARLREERFLVLAGAHAGGRYAAARMLLHRLGVPAVHALSPETSPSALATQLSVARRPCPARPAAEPQPAPAGHPSVRGPRPAQEGRRVPGGDRRELAVPDRLHAFGLEAAGGRGGGAGARESPSRRRHRRAALPRPCAGFHRPWAPPPRRCHQVRAAADRLRRERTRPGPPRGLRAGRGSDSSAVGG
ncbi:hypothetical protein ACFWN5_23880 [Streptomyces sp. NPDC058430]|uniref:hypothetical protein n=1 Tax=Streptomyces sp. NPDC058430 TaxID=3346495 RepID=UPI00365C92F7